MTGSKSKLISYCMMKRSIINLLFLLSVLLSSFSAPGSLQAQDDITCYSCRNKISGNYIEADGKYFHLKHFTCEKCGRPISGSYSEKEGKFYHPDCYAAEEGLICDHCSKIIRGEYINASGKKYHKDCYKDNVVPKCAICSKPIIGDYSMDIYGSRYHSYHGDEMERCDNCKRIISEATTGGGKSYSDGRHLCNICYSGRVTDQRMIDALYSRVIGRLKGFGFSFNEKSITVKGVDRKELRKAAGSDYNSNMHGFCRTTSVTGFVNKKKSGTVNTHTIYVLNGVPSLYIESVLAHELMHVWLNDNTKNNHSGQLREGSCNFISYLYLKSSGNPGAEQLIKMLENEDDDAYGEGFLKVRKKFNTGSLMPLFNYLKQNRSI